ncbi:MAG: hypothetical protein EBS01_08905, partial [Verrucomicrobia bacterium]|nr:hypothetical protein [Verrucomicrobiota bacterium]
AGLEGGLPPDFQQQGGRFQWRRDGVTLSKNIASGGSYTFTVAAPEDIATYEAVLTNDIGSTTSNPLVLVSEANPLQVGQELRSRVALAGTSFTWNDFLVTSGSLSTGSLTYTWTRNSGAPVPQTGGSLTLGTLGIAAADTYTVTASNGLYSVSSSAELRVFNPISAPQLTLKQGTAFSALSNTPLTLNAGQSATFAVQASGGDPTSASGKLRYQWFRSGTVGGAGSAISGATGSQYTLVSAGSSDANTQYWASVSILDPFTNGGTSNFGVAQQTQRVSLLVRQVPAISTQTVGPVRVNSGSLVSLTVASTAPDATFQWYKDGQRILTGGTAASYSFTATELSGGTYSVSLQNDAGSVSSAAIPVAVRVPVSITQQPDAVRTVNLQATVKLRVEAKGTGTLSFQWRKGGVALEDGLTGTGAILSGTRSRQLVIDNSDVSEEGDYDVVVSQVEDSMLASVISSKTALTINNAVQILSNPVDLTVVAGSSANLSVSAKGKTLKYQWRRNGVNLADGVDYAGATSSSLTVRSAVLGGDYDVLVSSGEISVASQSAKLEVLERLRLVTDLANAADLVPVKQGDRTLPYTLAPVLAGAGSYSYQWQKNGINISGGSGTASQLVVVASDTSATDKYRVVVSATQVLAGGSSTLSLGTVSSSEVRVGLMAAAAVTTPPEAVAADIGDSATLSVSATGGGNLTYQWEKLSADGSGVALPGATSSTYRVSELVPDDAGSYRVKVANARGATFSKYVSVSVRQKEFITAQPSAVTANPGDRAAFEVKASGFGLWDLKYQWRKDGVLLADNGTWSGAQSSKLVLGSVTEGLDGSLYDVVVSGTYRTSTASFTSTSARLRVNTPVSFDAQPKAPLLKAGGSATMFVKASGTPDIAYQWRRNGSDLSNGSLFSGVTSPVLTLNAPQTDTSAVSGIFDVVVSNVVGSVTSEAATVSVLSPVAITANPSGGSFDPYTAVQLSVTATGTAPLEYQWFKNGVAVGTSSATISGGTSDTLFIAAADPGSALADGDSGSYQVVVSNALNSVTSIPAVVDVKSQPIIISQPLAQTVNSGDGARFSVGVKGTAPFTYRWHKLS